jgi:RNA polymerase sigma factor (sigma-70 family)
MPKTDAEFHALMERVLAGSEEAAAELLRDYEPYLLHAIRKRLSKRIRPSFDSLDFAQDVWASVFAGDWSRRVFRSPAEFVAFLAKLAHNKVADAGRRRLKAPGQEPASVRSIDDSHTFDKDQLVARQPTPSHVVSKEDEWATFLRGQNLVYRRIYILYREGKTQLQIAEELKIHVRTVNRVVNRLAPGLVP